MTKNVVIPVVAFVMGASVGFLLATHLQKKKSANIAEEDDLVGWGSKQTKEIGEAVADGMKKGIEDGFRGYAKDVKEKLYTEAGIQSTHKDETIVNATFNEHKKAKEEYWERIKKYTHPKDDGREEFEDAMSRHNLSDLDDDEDTPTEIVVIENPSEELLEELNTPWLNRDQNRRDWEELRMNHWDELDGGEPHLIDVGEFEAECDDYEKVTLNYYTLDDVLVEENTQEVIDDIDKTVGHDCFAAFTKGVNEVYVRNHKLQIDYEVLRVDKSYEQEVLGVGLSPRELYRMRRLPNE